MQTTLRTKKLTFLALTVASLFVGAAYAQASRTLSLTYSITPTETVTTTPIQLGSITGGTQVTLNFPAAIQVSAQSGSHPMNATLNVPVGIFSKFLVTISSGNSNVCFLNSVGTPTCSWSFSGTTASYDVQVTADPLDGQASSGVATVTVAMG